MIEQPREHPVNCPWHPPTQPMQTWNASGVCGACERRLTAPALAWKSQSVVE